MEVHSEDIRDAILSKNFLRFVDSCGGWPEALMHTANLIHSLESTGDYQKDMPYNMTRFRIAAKLKNGNNGQKQKEIQKFFDKYVNWALEFNQKVPRNLTSIRKKNIWRMMRMFSNDDFSKALVNLANNEWLMGKRVVTLDKFLMIEKFESYLDADPQAGFMHTDGL